MFLFYYSHWPSHSLGITCFRLQIEREKLFVDIIEVLAAAMNWEQRATCILAREAEMSEFEDVIRFIVFCLFFT